MSFDTIRITIRSDSMSVVLKLNDELIVLTCVNHPNHDKNDIVLLITQLWLISYFSLKSIGGF